MVILIRFPLHVQSLNKYVSIQYNATILLSLSDMYFYNSVVEFCNRKVRIHFLTAALTLDLAVT